MKKTMILFTLCMSGTILCACQSADEPTPKLPDAQPIELRLAEKVETDNMFALDLFKTTYTNTSDANLFISPLSISMALSMTLNGAAGATAEEMQMALRAGGYSLEQINEYNQSLREALIAVDPSTQIAIANSIWYRNGFTVKNAFLDINRKRYDAEVSALNFDSPDALKTINGWCAKQTQDKIKTIIDYIPDDAVMYLINAVYFKGIWQSEFKKSDTRKEDFHPDTGARTSVDMMRQTQTFNYTSDETAAWIELPYGNNAFSMIVILPNEGKTTADVAGLLDNDTWNLKMTQLFSQEIILHLPRFKTECEYKLQETILPGMGMKLPFSDKADFGGISDQSTYISRVIHKTFVDVNEQGTEAAAVTAVETGVTSVGPSQPVSFIADKPFLFAIREKSTGVILFMGKIGAIQ